MNTSKDTRHGSSQVFAEEGLGRKLFRLFVQFCVCLLLIPAVLAGIGALVGLFMGSALQAMVFGLVVGLVLGGLCFTVIANHAGGSNSFPPGGYGGFGGSGGDGGGGSS